MISHTQFENRCERVRRLICDRPGITGGELSAATDSFREFDRKDVIAALIERGLVRVETTATRGRPRRNYWPICETTPAASPVTQPEQRRHADDPDPATMTREQILAFNEKRREENAIAAQIGLPPFALLPMPY
jgi:hypothetical protein